MQPIIKSPQYSNPSSPFGRGAGDGLGDDNSDIDDYYKNDNNNNFDEYKNDDEDFFEDEIIDYSLPDHQSLTSPTHQTPPSPSLPPLSLSGISLKSPQSILSSAEMIIMEALRVIPSSIKEYREYFSSLSIEDDSSSPSPSPKRCLLGTAILSALITPEIHDSLKKSNWRFPLDENLISLLQRLLTHRLIVDDEQVDLIFSFLTSRIKPKNISSNIELKLIQFYLSSSTSRGRPIKGNNLRLSLLRLAEIYLHSTNSTNKNASKAAITQIVHELMDEADSPSIMSDPSISNDCRIVFSWLCNVIRNSHCPPPLQSISLNLCSYIIKKHYGILFGCTATLKGQLRESLLPTMIGPLNLGDEGVLKAYLKVLEALFTIPKGDKVFPFQRCQEDKECVSIFLIRIFGPNLKQELKEPFKSSIRSREIVLSQIPMLFHSMGAIFLAFDRCSHASIPFITDLLPLFLYNSCLGIKKNSPTNLASSRFALLIESTLLEITNFLLKSSNILLDNGLAVGAAAATAAAAAGTLRYEEIYKKRSKLQEIITIFNGGKQIKALEMATSESLIPESSTLEEKISFIRNTRNLCKGKIGELIGDPRNLSYLEAFIKSFHFENLSFVGSLRVLLQSHRIPGESQVIGRILECFARHMVFCRPIIYKGQEDLLFQISFSTLMLNTDMYNDQVKKKMPKVSFITNTLRAIGDGEAIGPIKSSLNEILSDIYDEIEQEEIVLLGSFIEYPSFFIEGGCGYTIDDDDDINAAIDDTINSNNQNILLKEMLQYGEMMQLLIRANITVLFFLYSMSSLRGDDEMEWRNKFPTTILPQSLKNLGDLIDLRLESINFVIQKLFLIPLGHINNSHKKKTLQTILDWTINLAEEHSNYFDYESWESILRHRPALESFPLPSPIIPLLKGISMLFKANDSSNGGIDDNTTTTTTTATTTTTTSNKDRAIVYVLQCIERITTCELENLLLGTKESVEILFSLIREMDLCTFTLLERIGHEHPLILVSNSMVLGEYLSSIQMHSFSGEDEIDVAMEILVHISLLMVQTYLSKHKKTSPIDDQEYFTLWFPPLQTAFELGGCLRNHNGGGGGAKAPNLSIFKGFIEILEQQGKWMGPGPWKVVWKGYLFPLLDSYKDYIIYKSSVALDTVDAPNSGDEDSLIEGISSFIAILKDTLTKVISPALSEDIWFSGNDDDKDGDINNINSDGDIIRLIKELMHHSSTVPSKSDRKNTPHLLIFNGIFIDIIPSLLKIMDITKEGILIMIEEIFPLICRWEKVDPSPLDFSLFTRHCGAHLLFHAMLKLSLNEFPFRERLLSIINRSHLMAKRFNENIPLREEMVLHAFAPSLDSMLLTKQECGALHLGVEVLFLYFDANEYWSLSKSALQRVHDDIGAIYSFIDSRTTKDSSSSSSSYHKITQSKCWIELGNLIIEQWNSLMERNLLMERKVEMCEEVLNLLEVCTRRSVLISQSSKASPLSSGVRSSSYGLSSTTTISSSPGITGLQQMIDESKRFIISTIKK